MTKTRIQIYVDKETTSPDLNKLVGDELAADRRDGKPERTRNQVIEWILKLGIQALRDAGKPMRVKMSQDDGSP